MNNFLQRSFGIGFERSEDLMTQSWISNRQTHTGWGSESLVGTDAW